MFFASGDSKGIREQVRLFLQGNIIAFAGTPADFRKQCLKELKLAKQQGWLTAPKTLSLGEVAEHAAPFQRYDDLQGLIHGAEQLVWQMADILRNQCTNLGQLFRQTSGGQPPLVVSAFAYFFRREVEDNAKLFQGLLFDGLQKLSASQEQAFREVRAALDSLGDQFEEMIEAILKQLDRIEKGIKETHEVVLDIQVEMQSLGHTVADEVVRRIAQEVQSRMIQAGMPRGEVKSRHSVSIRTEYEKTAVKQLLTQIRQLPLQQQQQFPALLNGVGRLQFASQDFAGARETFVTVAENVTDAAARAEARFNAYHAALKEEKWDVALAAIKEAVSLDPQRFAPFPMERYEAKQILGAGGFGTAFLCYDWNLEDEVVIKTPHDAVMGSNTTDVLAEARLLRKVKDPAVISVLDCSKPDLTNKARPYFVMEYFSGSSMEVYIQQNGPLSAEDFLDIARQIAKGMQAVHKQNITHKDLKPDNILIYKEGTTWNVKIIDFGLGVIRSLDPTVANSRDGTAKFAPPEQTGDLKNVEPGPYSDVYAFGKTCCYALFQTTEPTDRLWKKVPETIRTDLKELLDQCREKELEHRLPSFDPVLKVLETLDPRQSQRKREEEARQKAELERKRREQEESEKQRQHDEQNRQKAELERKAREEEAKRQQLELLRKQQEEELRQKQELERKRREQEAAKTKAAPKPGEIITNSLGMSFAWIPPGSFMMGSPKSEADRSNDETQHQVTLTKGFYMGVHPVTQEQWQAVMGNNPSHFKAGNEQVSWLMRWFKQGSQKKPEENLPVEQVSWEDCQEFLKRLRDQDKKPYRLPTEAEWEYACRAGTTTPFYFGPTISTDQANYDGNYTYGSGKKGVYREKTTPVGTFPKNAWGLHDMHGNVWEWCQDWYGDYTTSAVVDPQGPNSGESRVLRGGSWFNYPDYCRAAFRYWHEPGFRYKLIGLRVCFCLDKITL